MEAPTNVASELKIYPLIYSGIFVEITPSEIPVFEDGTYHIIKGILEAADSNEREIGSFFPTESLIESLKDKAKKISITSKELQEAKDNKMYDILHGVIRGALYVVIVAATVFAGFVLFATNPVGWSLGLSAAGFAVGILSSLALSMHNSNWGTVTGLGKIMSLLSAPFDPVISVFNNISRLEKEKSTLIKEIDIKYAHLHGFHTSAYVNNNTTKFIRNKINQNIISTKDKQTEESYLKALQKLTEVEEYFIEVDKKGIKH